MEIAYVGEEGKWDGVLARFRSKEDGKLPESFVKLDASTFRGDSGPLNLVSDGDACFVSNEGDETHNQWFEFEFVANQLKCTGYTFRSGGDPSLDREAEKRGLGYPRAWQVLVSNDRVHFLVVDQAQSPQLEAPGAECFFPIKSQRAGRFIRFVMREGNSAGRIVWVLARVELFGALLPPEV